MHLTDQDGHPVTIFLQGIVMIAPGTHGGAYFQLALGGISTQETYEIVIGRLRRLEELAGGGEIDKNHERMKSTT